MQLFESKPNQEIEIEHTSLEAQLRRIKKNIGNAPVRKLKFDSGNLYARLEYHNHSGSVKDWAAYYILERAIDKGLVRSGTTIVESSSGNFALALAFICAHLKLELIPVIDPNINDDYEKVLQMLCKKVVKVEEKDATGGYLLTRINTVKSICADTPNSFWPNQYENEDNYLAYYYGLGAEICEQFHNIDYLFAATSSCGTITGLSLRLKERFPAIRIIAVDIDGSLIFSSKPSPRFIPGIGAGKVPSILQHALIDDVVHVSHDEIIQGCLQLLREQLILAGASSGAVYAAIKKYFGANDVGHATSLFICPDNGIPYMQNVYDVDWQQKTSRQIHKFNNPKP